MGTNCKSSEKLSKLRMKTKPCFKYHQQVSNLLPQAQESLKGNPKALKTQVSSHPTATPGSIPCSVSPAAQPPSAPALMHGPRWPPSPTLPAAPCQGAASPTTRRSWRRRPSRGLPPFRAVESSGSRQRCGLCLVSQLPMVLSVGRPSMTLPYACPGPLKASIPSPDKPRHPRRAQKSSLRQQDGADN